MAAEDQICSHLFGGDRSPMRRFSRNESVDRMFRDPVNLRAGGAGDDSDRARLLWSEIECFDRTAQRSSQLPN
jgi:hypothetical protein